MSVYRPGELDQRITIKRETLSNDDMGGDTISLATVATVWALVKADRGSESEDWDQVNANHTYRFVIRYRSDIRDDDRIEWNGYTFNIRSINDNGGRKMYLELFAERGVAL